MLFFFTTKLKIYYIYFLVLSFSFVSIVPTYVQVSRIFVSVFFLFSLLRSVFFCVTERNLCSVARVPFDYLLLIFHCGMSSSGSILSGGEPHDFVGIHGVTSLDQAVAFIRSPLGGRARVVSWKFYNKRFAETL